MSTTSLRLFEHAGFTRVAQETLRRATDAVATYKSQANEAARAGDEFLRDRFLAARAIAEDALRIVDELWSGEVTDPYRVWIAVDLLDDASERAAPREVQKYLPLA